jgi:hypothetical protein
LAAKSRLPAVRREVGRWSLVLASFLFFSFSQSGRRNRLHPQKTIVHEIEVHGKTVGTGTHDSPMVAQQLACRAALLQMEAAEESSGESVCDCIPDTATLDGVKQFKISLLERLALLDEDDEDDYADVTKDGARRGPLPAAATTTTLSVGSSEPCPSSTTSSPESSKRTLELAGFGEPMERQGSGKRSMQCAVEETTNGAPTTVNGDVAMLAAANAGA